VLQSIRKDGSDTAGGKLTAEAWGAQYQLEHVLRVVSEVSEERL